MANTSFSSFKSTKLLAKEAYEFAKRLAILSNESFDEFCSEDELRKIDEYEKQIKKINPKLKKIKEKQLGFKILAKAEEKNKAFSIDWRWSPEDLIFNLKKSIPKLPLVFKSEKWQEKTQSNKTSFSLAGKAVKNNKFFKIINF